MVQLRFFKIHISHKAQLTMIDMLLKWHHMGAVTIQQVRKGVALQKKAIKIR